MHVFNIATWKNCGKEDKNYEKKVLFFLRVFKLISENLIAYCVYCNSCKLQVKSVKCFKYKRVRDRVAPLLYSQVLSSPFSFFFFGRPRRYASGHVLFYERARNERGTRAKRSRTSEWVAALGISKTRNWSEVINHSPVGRSFDSFRSEATLRALAA